MSSFGGGARRAEEDSVTALFFLKNYREKLSRSGKAKGLDFFVVPSKKGFWRLATSLTPTLSHTLESWCVCGGCSEGMLTRCVSK